MTADNAPAYLVYPFEWACAICSAALVAPAITIVDKAIVSNGNVDENEQILNNFSIITLILQYLASGRESLWLSMINSTKSLVFVCLMPFYSLARLQSHFTF